jgi:hypothetical protein
MDQHELTNKEPTGSHGMSRPAADIKADLDLVARLISGLPTKVEPGEYEAALATHLTSLSTALQLQLEQNLEASGASHDVRAHVAPSSCPSSTCPLVACALSVAVAGLSAAAESALLAMELPANAEPSSPDANRVRARCVPNLLHCASPSLHRDHLVRVRCHVRSISRPPFGVPGTAADSLRGCATCSCRTPTAGAAPDGSGAFNTSSVAGSCSMRRPSCLLSMLPSLSGTPGPTLGIGIRRLSS